MKIHILYNFKDQPWGGGNQFLKALRKELDRQGHYCNSLEDADVILFNSYPFGAEHYFDRILQLKRQYPEKIIVFRLDGPISLIRGRHTEVDQAIALFNEVFVDGIVFQSKWCQKKNKEIFKISAPFETIIHNAPDKDIFNKKDKKAFDPEYVRLIATSWSANWRKGFDIYKFLDENLNFSRYSMTFIGNSPVEFKNIRWIKPLPSQEVAKHLKQHDIYITASRNDPCSNSLIEALSCGLPAVAMNDGGHPELIQQGGELFNSRDDVLMAIDKVADNYEYYASHLLEFSIEEVARQYYDFASRIYNAAKKGDYTPRRIDWHSMGKVYFMKSVIIEWKVRQKWESLTAKLNGLKK